MIVWINGAFGSGKTQASRELHRRHPHSYVFDPENAGYYIRKNMPQATAKDDFQDDPLWRQINYAMLKHIRGEFDGTIIVPMTIVNPEYFDEIVGRLRRDGITVNHYALCASRDVLLARLRSRFDGRNSWPAQQIGRCIEGLANEVFREHLDTDRLSKDQVVERIAEMAGLELLPDRGGAIRKALGRAATQIRHIRS
jgi:hypothetical protein